MRAAGSVRTLTVQGAAPWQTAAVSLPAAERPTRGQIAVAVAWTIVRLFIGFWVIFLMLTLVPDDSGGPVVLPFAIAGAAVAIYLWFFKRQLAGVYKARFPTLRAGEALVLVAAMFLAVFSMIYVMISLGDPRAFTEELYPFNAYYFSLTVLATVGFGDITPVTTLARSVTMVQMALDLVFIAVLLRVVGTAARRALLERQEHARAASAPAAVDD